MFSHIKELFTRPSGYTIARSVRLRSSASAYLNRTPASATNRDTWTWSGWSKRGTLSSLQFLFQQGADQNNATSFQFNSSNTLEYNHADSGVITDQCVTSAVFRDPSAWYHIVLSVDTTQATDTNRVKIYVNGNLQTLGTANYPAQNVDTDVNTANPFRIGSQVAGTPYYLDGYLTEINFIDGQALTPSSFGETDSITGVWKAKKYSGTYGTNGFYLNFSDNSSNTATTIGKDYSGNGNNWTPNNISVTSGATYDSMVDSPTTSAVSSNYAVLNPTNLGGTSITLSNGNLSATYAAAGWATAESTIAMNASGKYYFEFTKTDTSSQMVGIMPTTGSITSFVGNDANGYGYFSANGYLYNNAGGSITFGATFTTGDVIGVAFDASTGKLWFSKNNTWQASGDPSAGTNPAATASTAYSYIAGFSTNGSGVGTVNFGQRPFTYTPPTGFVALNTYNLPASTITNGAAYMAATTYTGNGTSLAINNSVNGVSFQPDFVWLKSRTNAYPHIVGDSVRGASNRLIPNTTDSEANEPTNIASINSNGFSVGSNLVSNASGASQVAWQWKAGGTSSSNTNGSITSTVSVGATQGFSVVTYTGTGANATVGHGLGVAPSMAIIKRRSTSGSNWLVYHVSMTATSALYLNTTEAKQTFSDIWNNTAPTSTVMSLGTTDNCNLNGGTYVGYFFAAVAGYSAFGSYTGNGSTDGPFVFTGFRPRFVLTKCSNGYASYWTIIDTGRNTSNVSSMNALWPNAADAESAAYDFDILSNGFKIRATTATLNQSGATYIYACFAENPFKNALAR